MEKNKKVKMSKLEEFYMGCLAAADLGEKREIKESRIEVVGKIDAATGEIVEIGEIATDVTVEVEPTAGEKVLGKVAGVAAKILEKPLGKKLRDLDDNNVM